MAKFVLVSNVFDELESHLMVKPGGGITVYESAADARKAIVAFARSSSYDPNHDQGTLRILIVDVSKLLEAARQHTAPHAHVAVDARRHLGDGHEDV